MTGAPPRPRRRTAVTAVRMLVVWSMLGLVFGVAALASSGQLVRLTFLSVLSGSMTPTLNVGDLIVAEVVQPGDLRAGDVVTFRDPAGDRYVTHRVQSVLWRGEIADVVTRGDANEVGEYWSVHDGGTVGRVSLHVPRLGYALGQLGTPIGKLALTSLAVVLGIWILVLFWIPRGGDGEDGARASDPVEGTMSAVRSEPAVASAH